MSEARTKATLARTASHAMGQASAATRSAAIQAAARLIRERTATIVASNRSDMERSRAAGMPGPLLDRLNSEHFGLAELVDQWNSHVHKYDS